ncbi:MAG: hypothetical protein K6C32_04780 [Bacilli bacterium]|nr:hypothetical protein [Bacilli bacterium]
MNTNYIYDYVNVLERVLSTGYHLKYSTNTLEREIAYSSFFQRIEKDEYGNPPIINDSTLISEIFPHQNIDLVNIPIYNQCLWVAEAYLRIQGETRLTFEAIFLYIPITNMYEYFPIFHEMDFSQIINEFKRLYESKSVLEIIVDKYQYSLKDISKELHTSYDTLYSFKKRRRDIQKVNVEVAARLASILRVRIETLVEMKI